MPGLNLPQPPLHLMAVLQPPLRDGLLQTLQGFLHAAGKTVSDGLLLFLAARCAAQNVSFLALPNGYLLHFHFRSNPRPVVFRQVRFELASSGCAACPPDTARRICGWPPDSPRSRYRDQTPTPCSPCRTCVRPCAESSPSTASLLATAVPPHHRPLPVHRRARRILPPPGYHRSDSPCGVRSSTPIQDDPDIDRTRFEFFPGRIADNPVILGGDRKSTRLNSSHLGI